MSETTPVVERVRAKLSCHHTIAVPAGQPVGATVTCDKCPEGKNGEPRVRRIKRLTGACPPPEVIIDAVGNISGDTVVILTPAEAADAESPKSTVPEGWEDFLDDVVCPVVDDVPKPADDRMERLELAKAEHQALKAWKAAGSKGDKPATPNLDAMNDDYAAGTKPTKSSKRTQRAAKNPRRVQATDAQKACNNKRGKGSPISDEDLAKHIATVRSEHPESTRTDELEFAYWAMKLAVSRPRWYAAWDAQDQAESGA